MSGTGRHRRRLAALGMVVVAASVVVGWRTHAGSTEGDGGRDDRPAGPHQVTIEEAGRLAQVLVADHQAGGARFQLTIATLDGGSLELDGTIDWEQHLGEATVVSSRAPEVTAVRWGGDVVYEQVRGLAEATGDEQLAWVSRPAGAADASDLDLAMHLLVRLASERAENAVLLSQDQGNRWLRTTTLRGEEVDVFAAGPKTRYWVRAGTSELVRMEGGATGDSHTIVVDLLERGPQQVEPPDPATVISREVLETLVAPPSTTVPAG